MTRASRPSTGTRSGGPRRSERECRTQARGLGKRYRRRWALSDCTLEVPSGRIAGLVGPNGAGKTTLLNLATGLLAPTSGSIEVVGAPPAGTPAQLAQVGFVAQDTPVYASLSVADHLRLGAHLNPGWDADLARRRIEGLDLDSRQRAGNFSGGQRAQLALTLAIAKTRLLLLDEPVASLDPLARREFLQDLMAAVAEHDISVVLSSHLVADLERVCDYIVVLVASRVRLAGEVNELLATHHLLAGPRRDPATLPAGMEVIRASHTRRQSTLLVRSAVPVDDPGWTVSQLSLEDVVLAYMSQRPHRRRPRGSPGGPVMIWLTWRQFRIQSWGTLAILAALAVMLAVTGQDLAHLYDTAGLPACQARGDCAALASGFLDQFEAGTYKSLLYLTVAVLLIAPAIMGAFWGAPLVTRELEAGTFRLAWNQSVTRTRWLAVKLGFIGLAAMVTAGLLSLMVTWWGSPVERASQLAVSRTGSSATNWFAPVLFDAHGTAPSGTPRSPSPWGSPPGS